MWKNHSQRTRYMLITVLSLLVVSGLYRFLYLYDNKYTYPTPSAVNGVLHLPDEVSKSLLVPLVRGWEFYAGELLTPQDFKRGDVSVPKTVSIGPTASLIPDSEFNPPHGSGTYRLRIRHEGDPVILRIELPEIFSASGVWINGSLTVQTGEPSAAAYRPHVKRSIESFVLDGDCEIIVQAANYSYHYSGIFSPPMLGTPQAIDNMLFWQLIVDGLLFFSSITLALFLVAVWRKLVYDRLYRYFGMMALCFAASVSFPFWQHFGGSLLKFGLILNSFGTFSVMLCVAIINRVALGVSSKNLLYRITLALGIASCAVTVLFPMFVFPYAPMLLRTYTAFLDLNRLTLCVFMFYAVINALRAHPVMAWIIPGNIAYGLGLMLEVRSPHHFDPIFGGWPMEYCGFALVVLFAMMVVRYNWSILRENEKLNARLEDEVAQRTTQIMHVLQERKRFLSGFAHDLKAPVSAIQTYMELIHMGHIKVESELESYLKVIEQKSTEMQRRVETLQLFTAHDDGVFSDRERIELRAFLRKTYQSNLPDAEANGVFFKLCLPDEDAYIMAWRNKLTSAIENILYNAISFMPDGGILMLAMFCRDNWVDITISDTGRGISPEHLPHIFDEHFSTRDEAQNYATFKRGLGLYLAQATVRELNGEITAYSDWGNGAEFNIQLPTVK